MRTPLSSPGDAGDSEAGSLEGWTDRQCPGLGPVVAGLPIALNTLSVCLLRVQPSETCGPFRGLETIYKSGKRWVLVLEKSNPNITWFAWVYQHLFENKSLLFFMSVALM